MDGAGWRRQLRRAVALGRRVVRVASPRFHAVAFRQARTAASWGEKSGRFRVKHHDTRTVTCDDRGGPRFTTEFRIGMRGGTSVSLNQ